MPSHPSLDGARFLPGATLAGRYRIVALMGRGGMGEVYRANDLKLGQTVALKFLPEGLDKDEKRLGRFLNEVRTARQVTHSNVCRVFDIGEVDGQHYLSMEYVDGEDLASLLRRIGRLPKDKATQVARQICAGLAAAHEQGILHRDLKPANVMIDGRGRVKIADFGLAGLAEAIEAGEIRSGTPAYMAPEQLAGKEVTVRSDLYSLGLVIYELFTGKQAFEATTTAELARLQRDSTPTSPSSHVEGMDSAVEAIILRCLEREPQDRPASAMAVAAALPGGDPLAAALAAGETPSPQMVADAGASGGLRPAVGLVALALVLAGLAGIPFLAERASLAGQVSLDPPPEALSVEARRIIEEAGYTQPPVDAAYGFDYDLEYMQHVREQPPEDRWKDVAGVRPAPVRFWYRQSPRYLTPVIFSDDGYLDVTRDDPPNEVSGMVGLLLDPQGRLVQFDAIPPQIDDSGDTGPEPDWSGLFERAGIDPADFTPAPPRWNPLVDCDLRRAWEGAYPDHPDVPIRVEAGAWRGRAVFFKIVTPWAKPWRMEVQAWAPGEKAAAIIGFTLMLGVLVGGVVLARRNLRLGRGDRRSAFRVGLLLFLTGVAEWILGGDHQPTFAQVGLFIQNLMAALFFAAATWMVYIALEPYVRRLWPDAMISWNRLLQGRFQDPMVGRDTLVGALFGLGVATLGISGFLLQRSMGLPSPEPFPVSLNGLDGVRQSIAEAVALPMVAIGQTMIFLFILLLLCVVLRRRWAAAGVLVLVLTTLRTLGSPNPAVEGPISLLYWGLLIFVLVRFGMVAFLSARIFTNCAWWFVFTTDLSSWYAGRSLLPLLLLAVLAAYGFYVSLAGRPLLGEAFLEAEATGKP